MKKIEDIKRMLHFLNNASVDTLGKSMNNTHGDGIFSLVIDGAEHGKLTRVFIADKKLKPYQVQLHTHRYPIRLTVITGNIMHHRGYINNDAPDAAQMSLFEYKSPLNGGCGLKYIREVIVICVDSRMAIGSVYNLSVYDFHTMSVSKGSMWVVEELGFEKEESEVLGVPFITDGLYTTPSQYQINDKVQVVRKELQNLLNAYASLAISSTTVKDKQ